MKLKGSLNLGKVAGIKLYVHWTFLILIVWIFLIYYRIDNDINQGLIGVLFILALFVCVVLHELGHALTAKRYKIITKSITLLPIGGLANLEKMPENPKEELLIAIAGPLVNVAIALVLYLVLVTTNSIPDLAAIQQENGELPQFNFWFQLFIINVLLVVFNLIPAFPMDGGRMLRAALSFKLSRGRATTIAAGIGQFFALVFVLLGLYANIWLIFIGIFIFLGAGAEAAFESAKSALTGYKVKDAMMKKYTLLSAEDTLEKAVKLLLDGQEQDFVVAKNDNVKGILTRNELIKGLSAYGNASPVSQVMRTDFLTLHPNMPLQEVYQKLITNKYAVAPVVEHGELVGIVNKENIDELIAVKEALHNSD